jgi:LacI family transcriptional regulator
MASPRKASAESARRRVTVRSIADAAGVSIAAVSSVLNNRQVERRIAPATVQKIREASARLGYLPNIAARRLRSGAGARSNLVIALVSTFEAPITLVNHFIFALRRAFSEERSRLNHLGFSVMIEMYPAGRLAELPGLLSGDHFNAAILMNTTAEDDQFLGRSHLPYPVVLVNRVVPGYAAVLEEASAGSRAAELLLRGRRRSLAVIRGSPPTQITQMRTDRFLRGAVELGARAPAEIVAPGLSELSGYEAMAQHLARGGELDGLYAVSDGLALGAYRALKERGRSIPGDVAVIGTGDYEIGPLFDPPLSSIGVSREEVAEAVVEVLVRQLGRKSRPDETKVVPVRTCLRASSGHKGT